MGNYNMKFYIEQAGKFEIRYDINGKLLSPAFIIPTVYNDNRGYFKESFRENELEELIGRTFVQDNVSKSHVNVLRGLHGDYNVAKLIQILSGLTYHVIVDANENSPTFMQWDSFIMDPNEHKMLFVPEGWGNGMFVLKTASAGEVILHYKQTNYHNPETEFQIEWCDEDIKITWPFASKNIPIISKKDRTGPFLDFSRDIE
jgi:dTDP-4-dehydrorhamnose 3,5-epimerase